MCIFSFSYYLFINSWQSISFAILLFAILFLLLLWLYKSGYRIQKKPESEKINNQNVDEASHKRVDEQSESSDLAKSADISNLAQDSVPRSEEAIQISGTVSVVDEREDETEKNLHDSEGIDGVPVKEDKNKGFKKNRPTILVVDDDLAIRKYLMSILREDFNVLQEVNGEEGLNTVKKEIPDLIISDIMMPVMDGIEFCEEIRNDSSMSYLPFIMLTSKIGDQEKLKGLQSGADAYLEKPFNAHILLETVKNTLSSRKKLLEKNQQSEKGKYTLPISSEESFLKELDEVINSRIDDCDLSIEDIANELNISVRQLQRKVKEDSGFTPTKYLRYRRLKAAEYLLKNDSGTITEIAFAVGFNNLSLFSSYFKAEFNVLPSTLKSTNKRT